MNTNEEKKPEDESVKPVNPSAASAETVIEKKKKRFKTAIIIVIAALILLYVIVNGLSWISKKVREQKQDEFEELIKRTSITFYPEDDSILESKEYLDFNRYVKYTNNAESYYITKSEDLASYPPEFRFMNGLIENIIHGEADEYNAAFVDNYWKNNEGEYRESFAKQALYNIEIEFIKNAAGDLVNSDETGAFYYVNTDYKVSYMIYRNNGSFRVDLPEEAYIPVVYKVWAKYRPGILEPFEIKVYEVINYSKYESGLFD